eukprot:91466-Prorocentrum_minimum.AAC.4
MEELRVEDTWQTPPMLTVRAASTEPALPPGTAAPPPGTAGSYGGASRAPPGTAASRRPPEPTSPRQ